MNNFVSDFHRRNSSFLNTADSLQTQINFLFFTAAPFASFIRSLHNFFSRFKINLRYFSLNSSLALNSHQQQLTKIQLKEFYENHEH